MKKSFLFIAFCFIATTAFAQAPLDNGDLQLNAGFGLSGWGTPVYIGVDYGIADDITIGGELSYRSYGQRFGGDNFNSSIIGIQANGNYHFTRIFEMPSKWDLYAGLGLNYYSWSTDDRYKEFAAETSGIGVGIQIGARYFFTDKFGVNLEFGGGNATSGGKVGITYKL